MSNSRQTDFEPPLDSLLDQLLLKEPSAELDRKIAAVARNPQHRNSNVPSSLRVGWPTVVSVALVAGLFGFVFGNQLDLASDKSNRDSPTDVGDLDSDILQQNRRLVSTEIENGIEAFHWIHGHSIESVNQNCSACHVFNEPAEAGFFYDRDILAQHPDFFPKCSRCHTASFSKSFASDSNS